jgi:hypothetical protein
VIDNGAIRGRLRDHRRGSDRPLETGDRGPEGAGDANTDGDAPEATTRVADGGRDGHRSGRLTIATVRPSTGGRSNPPLVDADTWQRRG